MLAGLRQALDRLERGSGHEEAQYQRQRHAQDEHCAQDQAQVAEHLVDLVQRAGDLKRSSARQRGREHAEMGAAHLRVREARLTSAAGELCRGVLDRKPGGLAVEARGPAAGVDELDVSGRAAQPFFPRGGAGRA
jgi:hypothetical protein